MVKISIWFIDKVIFLAENDKRKKGEQKFCNKTASRYDAWVDRAFQGQYRSILSKLNSYIQTNDAILDLGTGTGEITFNISKNSKSCVGVDISPKMISIANKKKRGLHQQKVTFQVEDAYNLSFPDTSFDKVICCNVLQTMKDPLQAIKEGKRVLKPGGEFLSFTYCYGDSSLIEQLKLIKWVFLYGMPKYWTNFKRKSLTDIFRSAGLKVVETEDVWQKPVILFLRCEKI